MRLFVTGGTGFLGSHFLSRASAAGHDLVAIRRPGSSPAIALEAPPTWLERSLGEVTSEDLSGADALVHFASHGVSPQKTDWSTATEINVRQSTALLEKATAAGIGRILLCGSCFEYGRSGDNHHFIPADAALKPMGPYAASKAAFTVIAGAMAAGSDSEFVLLRPFHIYGDGQHEDNFWPSLRSAALAGQDFAMTAGEQIRDFQPVEEAVDAFLDALAQWPGRKGAMHVANLGTGSPTTLAEFARKQWQVWNAPGKLDIGAIPYRDGEIMRYVPEIKP